MFENPLNFALTGQFREGDIADERKIIRGNSQPRICKSQECTTRASTIVLAYNDIVCNRRNKNYRITSHKNKFCCKQNTTQPLFSLFFFFTEHRFPPRTTHHAVLSPSRSFPDCIICDDVFHHHHHHCCWHERC